MKLKSTKTITDTYCLLAAENRAVLTKTNSWAEKEFHHLIYTQYIHTEKHYSSSGVFWEKSHGQPCRLY
ncbi:unnamed protein product [Parnassius mnemosyne]|uniref:Uncharacterized protein n=1 Tax=Parnassius mnemosyne TaxID=213953 RepID=A0AAV1KW79_9NEOP